MFFSKKGVFLWKTCFFFKFSRVFGRKLLKTCAFWEYCGAMPSLLTWNFDAAVGRGGAAISKKTHDRKKHASLLQETKFYFKCFFFGGAMVQGRLSPAEEIEGRQEAVDRAPCSSMLASMLNISPQTGWQQRGGNLRNFQMEDPETYEKVIPEEDAMKKRIAYNFVYYCSLCWFSNDIL